MRGGPIIIMKQYSKPTIKVKLIALQQLLCGSVLGINDKEVDENPSEGEKPKTWGTIW